MKKTVTFENVPLTLVGRKLTINTQAPRCILTDQKAEEVTFDSFDTPVKLVTFFASLDTPVCDLQIREFNRRARELADERVVVLGISMDLPFAQKRFSETFGIRNMTLLSDHRYSSFGINYGVLIRDWKLLARGAVILDREKTIRYFQLVEEIANPPDFDDAFNNLKEVLEKPGPAQKQNPVLECTPYGGKVSPLPANALGTMMAQVPGWELIEGNRIVKKYKFKSFTEAKYFLDVLSQIAEEQGHHPTFNLNYNRLQITLTTHAEGGITENDLIMAGIINQLD